MLRNLLYVAGPKQLALAEDSLSRLGGGPPQQGELDSRVYMVEHKQIHPLKVRIYVVENNRPIIEHLQNKDIDLLIYDERAGEFNSAISAIETLKKDVEKLAKHWGPEFHFPIKRCMAILNDTPDAAERAFILGRDHVKEVIVDPHSMVKVLKKIGEVLAANVNQRLHYKTGMALSGGALEGFLYQLGAVHALDQAMVDYDTRSFQTYSGVSSGSIIASLLACKIKPLEVIRSIQGKSDHLPHLTGKTLFDFAAVDVSKRVLKSSMRWTGVDPTKILQNFLRAIPTGFFKGAALKEYFEQALDVFGAPNQFDDLEADLYVGATNQDTLQHKVFRKNIDVQPTISEAVRASCALPPFFTPQKIGTRRYIDGQITRTCNLSQVVEDGCRLIFIVDPLKPFASYIPGSVDKEGGVFTLIQTVKALVHSRFSATLSHLTERFPDVDFIVIQPDSATTRKMAGSPMRYKIRDEIIDIAYRSTLRKLIDRYDVYATKLDKHGIRLKSADMLIKLENQGLVI